MARKLQALWSARRDSAGAAADRLSVLARAPHGEGWLWPDLPSIHDLEDEAPRTLGKATERMFLPLIRMTVPDLYDMNLPLEGVFHNCAIVSIDKRYPKQAHKVMNAIWGAGLMSLTKLVVVVDADCDVHDHAEVAWRAFGNVDYGHDVLITEGPVDHLDHSSYQQFWGGKAGVDATRKRPDEGYTREWPDMIVQDPDVVARVSARWAEYGL